MGATTELIWENFSKRIKGFVLSKVKDQDECNDIVQNVFMKIHLNLKDLKNNEKLEQWIFQIARNEVNDLFRKKKTMVSADEVEVKEELSESKNNWRFAKCLTSFVKYLPQKYKEAITLVDLDNLSQLDLANKLNISYSGAKSRVQRGRELLKEQFLNCCKVSTDKYGNIVSANSKCTSCQA